MYLRALHPIHFNHPEKRFSSTACAVSSDGGLSVVSEQCANIGPGAIHSHFRNYYPAVSSEPPIFWRINGTNEPADVLWKFERSKGNDDDCHMNGRSSTNEPQKKFRTRISKHFKSATTDFAGVFMCEHGAERPFTLADIDRFKP